MKRDITRRKFMQNSAAAAAAGMMATESQAAPQKIRYPREIGPDEKVNVAAIGAGGKGASDIKSVEEAGANIVALCDADDAHAAQTYLKYPNIPHYRDYRKMLKEMDDQIDAVTISTPDHVHFPAAEMAIEMGKHAFVQKPLTHTVQEARELEALARKHKVATIMGNQGHASEGTRLVKEWIAADAIGPIHEVHLWTNRPLRTGSYKWVQGVDRPKEVMPVPDTLDWNLWLNVVPFRPFHETYVPFRWRAWWDFGCGALGDMACHIMDAAYWGLNLTYPTTIDAVSSPVNNETAPEWSIVTYEFAERDGMPPVKVVWHDGEKLPPRPKDLETGRELDKNGQLFLGEKGTIMAGTYCSSPRLIPETAMRDFMPNAPAKTIPRIPDGNHYKEWLNACKGGTPAGSNFDYAGPFTQMVLLGNTVLRAGSKIEFDAEAGKITNIPEANKYLTKNYREF